MSHELLSTQHSAHRSIALIGLSGSGKSSVGRLLAVRLGWCLADTDALIVEADGRSVAEIFAQDGEAHFRDLEAAALERALAAEKTVIATGAGIVLREENRSLLHRRTTCIWLDASTDQLLLRLQAHAEQRPLLAGAPPAIRIEALRAGRAALYAALADLTFATDSLAPEQVADRIVLRLCQNGAR